MHRVFVYGTLKKGFSNHNRILEGYDIKITPAWTYGMLYDLGYFPALTEGNNKVYGELIEFDNLEILRRVDSLEGFRGENSNFNFYDRKEVQVYTNEKTIFAWVFFISANTLIDYDEKIISSGVWNPS